MAFLMPAIYPHLSAEEGNGSASPLYVKALFLLVIDRMEPRIFLFFCH